MQDDRLGRSRPQLRDWLLVAACLAATMCMGEVLWSFGVFFKALESEFDWSRAVISSGYTLLAMAQGTSAVLSGRISDRYRPPYVLAASALIAGPAIVALSRVSAPLHFQLLLMAVGLGTGATVPVPLAVVQRYFRNRLGSRIALGVVASGMGLGALVFAPLLNALINGLGWRDAFVIAGIIFALLAGGSAFAMSRYALPAVQRWEKGQDSGTVRDLVLTRQFIGVVLVAAVGMLGFQVLSVHLVPYSTDAGISLGVAAAGLGMIGGLSVPGRLVSGVLSIRFGWGRTLTVSLIASGTAIVLLPAVRTDLMLYAFVAFYGFFHGVRAVSAFGLVGHLFGGRSVGELTGIVVATSNIVGAIGPYLAGQIHDVSGEYSAVFVAVGLLVVVTGFLPFVLHLDRPDGLRGTGEGIAAGQSR